MSTGTVIADSLSVRATMRHSMKYPWSLFEAVSMFDGFSSITLPSAKLWNFESEPAMGSVRPSLLALMEAKDHHCSPSIRPTRLLVMVCFPFFCTKRIANYTDKL